MINIIGYKLFLQKTDDGQSKRFQNDLAEWLRQQKEIYEKELADL